MTMAEKKSNEAAYFDALKRIASYTPPDRMRRDNERGRGYGLEADEEIELAYENVIQEAKNAIRGKRRPKIIGGAA
jgi:hypothetical protein